MNVGLPGLPDDMSYGFLVWIFSLYPDETLNLR
jgi:hypothetical protein